MEETKPFTFFGITRQQQPTKDTCAQTCLAMALGIPVSQVIDRYGGDPMDQQMLTKALTECGFIWDQLVMGVCFWQGWYFAAAPSLNYRGKMHQVLFHWDGASFIVLDPSAEETYKMDGSDLCRDCLTPFILGGKLPIKP